MSVHNRIGLMVVGVLMVLVFAGAGCGSREKPGASKPAVDTPSDASVPASADGGEITNWVTYRSAALGIAIPYPEGWYVREDRGEEVTTLLVDPTPLPPSGSGSDSPIRVTVTVTMLPLEDALAAYELATTTAVVLSNTRVTKVEYRSELGSAVDEPSYREAYHWNRGGRLYTVDGLRGDVVVARITSELAAQEE